MSIHINLPSQSVSLPATPGYWRDRSGGRALSPAVCLRWESWVARSTVLPQHGQEWGAVSLYWHHRSLISGWEEGGTDEICKPTPQMPLSYPAPAPPSRQEGVFLEGTLTVREPVPPRQSCPPHQSGDIRTCLSSCLGAEDGPRGDGQSCSEFNIGYTRFPLLESLYHCTTAPLDNGTSSPQGSSEAEPYCISPLQAGTGSPAL